MWTKLTFLSKVQPSFIIQKMSVKMMDIIQACFIILFFTSGCLGAAVCPTEEPTVITCSGNSLEFIGKIFVDTLDLSLQRQCMCQFAVDADQLRVRMAATSASCGSQVSVHLSSGESEQSCNEINQIFNISGYTAGELIVSPLLPDNAGGHCIELEAVGGSGTLLVDCFKPDNNTDMFNFTATQSSDNSSTLSSLEPQTTTGSPSFPPAAIQEEFFNVLRNSSSNSLVFDASFVPLTTQVPSTDVPSAPSENEPPLHVLKDIFDTANISESSLDILVKGVGPDGKPDTTPSGLAPSATEAGILSGTTSGNNIWPDGRQDMPSGLVETTSIKTETKTEAEMPVQPGHSIFNEILGHANETIDSIVFKPEVSTKQPNVSNKVESTISNNLVPPADIKNDIIKMANETIDSLIFKDVPLLSTKSSPSSPKEIVPSKLIPDIAPEILPLEMSTTISPLPKDSTNVPSPDVMNDILKEVDTSGPPIVFQDVSSAPEATVPQVQPRTSTVQPKDVPPSNVVLEILHDVDTSSPIILEDGSVLETSTPYDVMEKNKTVVDMLGLSPEPSMSVKDDILREANISRGDIVLSGKVDENMQLMSPTDIVPLKNIEMLQPVDFDAPTPPGDIANEILGSLNDTNDIIFIRDENKTEIVQENMTTSTLDLSTKEPVIGVDQTTGFQEHSSTTTRKDVKVDVTTAPLSVDGKTTAKLLPETTTSFEPLPPILFSTTTQKIDETTPEIILEETSTAKEEVTTGKTITLIKTPGPDVELPPIIPRFPEKPVPEIRTRPTITEPTKGTVEVVDEETTSSSNASILTTQATVSGTVKSPSSSSDLGDENQLMGTDTLVVIVIGSVIGIIVVIAIIITIFTFLRSRRKSASITGGIPMTEKEGFEMNGGSGGGIDNPLVQLQQEQAAAENGATPTAANGSNTTNVEVVNENNSNGNSSANQGDNST